MTPYLLFTCSSTTPDQTADLARRMGAQLSAPAVICLDGPVGSGKTHFARAFIQSLQVNPEHVPSPSYTLVQTYETRRGPIWHTDLYRLTSAEEAEELGLTEPFDNVICLIEWPDRLGDLLPRDALRLRFDPDRQEISGHSLDPTRWQMLRAQAHV